MYVHVSNLYLVKVFFLELTDDSDFKGGLLIANCCPELFFIEPSPKCFSVKPLKDLD